MTRLETLHKKWSMGAACRAAYDALENEFALASEPKGRLTVTGSKMTSTTLDEMRAARALGKSASDFERIRREAKAGIEPAVDDDSPDASELIRSTIDQRRAEHPRSA